LSVDPKGQAQIEFQDGAILNLSQGARAMLTNIGSGARGQSEIAVLSGWAKFAQKKTGKGAQYRYLTPRAEITAGEATAVVNAGDGSTDIYVESGAVRFSEIAGKGVQRLARRRVHRPQGRAAGNPRPASLGGVHKEHAAAFSGRPAGLARPVQEQKVRAQARTRRDLRRGRSLAESKPFDQEKFRETV
jgi:hypothetical protein